jgi:hypothetical protein
MEVNKTDLKTIFDFVQQNQWTSARQIGKGLEGGKSRANHYLYGYLDILFTKKGLTPPQWQVISNDAYSKMLERVNPSPVTTVTPLGAANVTRKKSPLNIFKNSFKNSLNTRGSLSQISICNSCDLPIKPSGLCGCS